MNAVAPLFLASALALPAAARTPDYPGLPVCQDDRGRVVEMQDQGARGDWVVFWTEHDRDPMGEIVLANCETLRALRVRQGRADNSLSSAAIVVRDAVWDDTPHSLADIQDSLRAKGFRASRGSIPAGHCACGLAATD